MAEPVTTTAGGTAAGVIGTVAGIAGIVGALYPILDSIARERGSSKAYKTRNELNNLLSEYNLKISDIRNEIEKRGINYNKLVDSLNTVSVAGRAHKVKEDAAHRKAVLDSKQMSQINKLQNQADLVSAEYNKKAEDQESRGLVRTIGTRLGIKM